MKQIGNEEGARSRLVSDALAKSLVPEQPKRQLDHIPTVKINSGSDINVSRGIWPAKSSILKTLWPVKYLRWLDGHNLLS